MPRTFEDRYFEYANKGRSVEQMRSVAVARGDTDFIKYLEAKMQEPEVDMFA